MKEIKLRKVLILLLIGIFFTLSGCKKEVVIQGENLEAVKMNDNYCTYYEIFLGAFSDSNNDGIGDLRGLINRLDYLNDGNPNSGKSLGIDGIWLMPIMVSPSYHKYDVRDYYNIDPSYGTIEDFKDLIKECNNRNVKVIIDLVLNHTSNYHKWFVEAKKAIQNNDMNNKYINYYSIVKGKEEMIDGCTYYELANGYYYEGNFSSSMPELNYDNPEVREEVVKIAKYWLDLGVSGFRLDAAKYIYYGNDAKSIEFWDYFEKECKKIKKDVYLVGEVWSPETIISDYYQAINCFDFGMSQSTGMVAMAAKGIEDINSYVKYVSNYYHKIKENREDAILNPFIANHDTNRAAGFLSLDDYTMQMAANLYMLMPGNPFIYYGEEIGLKGVRNTENTDANRRLKMLWGDGDTVKNPVGATYPDSAQTNGTVKDQLSDKNSLYNHYKKLIMLRNANPEIARGDYTPLDFDGYQSFGGFISTYNGSSVLVLHNVSDRTLTIDLSKFNLESYQVLRGFVGKGNAKIEGNNLIIFGKTSVILK